jgi:hypothetical protein
MLANYRAKTLFSTVSHRGGPWCLTPNVEAADLHPGLSTRPARTTIAAGGWGSIAVCRPSWSLLAFAAPSSHA